MLDTDADRVRVDRLRAFVEARKQAAQQRRTDAIEDGLAVGEPTGEIEAFDAVLQYLDAKSDDVDSPSLDVLRTEPEHPDS